MADNLKTDERAYGAFGLGVGVLLVFGCVCGLGGFLCCDCGLGWFLFFVGFCFVWLVFVGCLLLVVFGFVFVFFVGLFFISSD